MRTLLQESDQVGAEIIQRLASEQHPPCISIFMPVRYRGGAEIIAEPLHVRRLLETVRDELTAQGVRHSEIAKLLAPMIPFTENNKEFWLRQSEGIAFFLAAGTFFSYCVPLALAEQVYVGDHFFIKPLLPLLYRKDRFYLLALSQNHVRLFAGDADHLEELPLTRIPTSLAEASKYDQVEISLQAHSTSSSGLGNGGRRAELFHGHGSAGEESVTRKSIHSFLQQVDSGVNTLLAEEDAPLLLAGVDTMIGYYRQVNRYRHLLEQTLDGSPDRIAIHQLHARAWGLMQPIVDQSRQLAIARYSELLSQGRAANELHSLPFAAYDGRIDTLFVNPANALWGSLHLPERRIDLHAIRQPGDQELSNFAAIHTIRNNGAVYTTCDQKLPDGAQLAAILRY